MAVLQTFTGKDTTDVTLTTDFDFTGVRSYTSFADIAQEIGVSRCAPTEAFVFASE